MLAGRTAAPLPDTADAAGIGIADRLGGRDPVVIESVPGAVQVAALAADLAKCGCPPLWARLAPFELDPTALTPLARAVLDRCALNNGALDSDVLHAGIGIADDHGCAPYAACGRPAAVVESPDILRARALLDQVAPALGRAGGARHVERVVLHLLAEDVKPSDRDPTRRPREQKTNVLLADRQVGPHLTKLLTGRHGLLRGIVQVDALIGRSALAGAVSAATSAEGLTRMLRTALMLEMRPDYHRRLRMAAILGYAHERLAVLAPLLADATTYPWWIPLEGGWYQVDPAWRSALAATEDGALPVAVVASLVAALVDLAAPEEALEFCLDAACPGLASDLLAELTSSLLAANRTRELQRWLRRLPPQEHARHAPLLARIGPLPPSNPAEVAPSPPAAAHRRWWRARGRHRSRRPTRLPPRAARGLSHAADLRPGPSPGSSPSASLTMAVRLLGPVEIRLDGRAVEQWQGKVGRTALAYVLLQRRRVPPDELASALWPDVPTSTARNRMHVALCRLRADLAAVDPRPVLVHQQGYALDPSLRLDLDTDRFERHAGDGDDALRDNSSHEALTAYLAAVDCYGGELLAGERDDEWALLAREHYRVRFLDMLGKAAQLALDLDRLALAVEVGHRLLALDFCREDLHRLLMRAYARLGQPHLALRQFQTCARQLRLEFGLDPAPATVELFEQLRCQVQP